MPNGKGNLLRDGLTPSPLGRVPRSGRGLGRGQLPITFATHS